MAKRKRPDVFLNLAEGKAFGQHLKELRNKAKLSQQKLADEADVAKSTIARIEAGQINITVDLIFTLAKALKTHHKNLLDFEA